MKKFVIWLSIWLSLGLLVSESETLTSKYQADPALQLVAVRKPLYACQYKPYAVPCEEIERALLEAVAEFGIDEMRFRRSIACESSFNPTIVNGQYKGMMQEGNDFLRRWIPRFDAAVDPDIENGSGQFVWQNPFHNLRIAAYVISLNGYGEWECKG